jgi:uncharacterized protein (DUF924 family)
MDEPPGSSPTGTSRAESVLVFWFAPELDSEAATIRSRWFVPNPEFDQLCKTRFLTDYEDAARGRLDDWRKEPRSCLALVLLLDQFPRNMFRDTAQAFATDAKALELSGYAIGTGFDRTLPLLMRMFFYLPLQHSEKLDDQLESVRLTSALVTEDSAMAENLKHAEQHLETIRRFGRFPGRNDALGRQSTQEEMNFLEDQKQRLIRKRP